MIQPTIRRIATLAPFIIAGLAWRLGGHCWWIGPLASLILPLTIPSFESRQCRFTAAFLYFGAGSIGLISGSGVFFGTGIQAYIFGAILWLASSDALAAPWTFARNGKMAVLAILVDAIPPIGLFGWISPLAAAGVLFPCGGLFGILMLLTVVALIERRPGVFEVTGLIILTVLFNHFYGVPPARPSAVHRFIGVDTAFSRIPADPMAVIQRNQRIIAIAERAGSGVKNPIIVLPETLAIWRTGTAHQFEAAVPPGQTWLLGATTLMPNHKRADSIVEIHHNQPSRTLFSAVFPVPVSMWKPWSAKPGGYSATWFQPVQHIAGIRVAAVICYDQLLTFPWLETALEPQPAVILAISNDWWARGTGIPTIQRNSSKAWSRLIGARLVLASNR